MFQNQKKMFKVLSPVDKPNGTKWWMHCGSGYENKDNSINMYINALPVGIKPGPLTLQLRELTEAELRERDAKRAAYPSRGTGDAHDGSYSSRGSVGAPVVAADQSTPF